MNKKIIFVLVAVACQLSYADEFQERMQRAINDGKITIKHAEDGREYIVLSSNAARSSFGKKPLRVAAQMAGGMLAMNAANSPTLSEAGMRIVVGLGMVILCSWLNVSEENAEVEKNLNAINIVNEHYENLQRQQQNKNKMP